MSENNQVPIESNSQSEEEDQVLDPEDTDLQEDVPDVSDSETPAEGEILSLFPDIPLDPTVVDTVKDIFSTKKPKVNPCQSREPPTLPLSPMAPTFVPKDRSDLHEKMYRRMMTVKSLTEVYDGALIYPDETVQSLEQDAEFLLHKDVNLSHLALSISMGRALKNISEEKVNLVAQVHAMHQDMASFHNQMKSHIETQIKASPVPSWIVSSLSNQTKIINDLQRSINLILSAKPVTPKSGILKTTPIAVTPKEVETTTPSSVLTTEQFQKLSSRERLRAIQNKLYNPNQSSEITPPIKPPVISPKLQKSVKLSTPSTGRTKEEEIAAVKIPTGALKLPDLSSLVKNPQEEIPKSWIPLRYLGDYKTHAKKVDLAALDMTQTKICEYQTGKVQWGVVKPIWGKVIQSLAESVNWPALSLSLFKARCLF